MSASLPVCPQCNFADKTYKVSLLYLEGSARLSRRERENQPVLEAALADLLPEESSQAVEDQVIKHLIRTFTPPEGEKRVTRRIHPDGMVAVFTLVAGFLIIQIAGDQPGALPAAAIILTAALGAYLLSRKSVVGKYEDTKREEVENFERIEKEVNRWMRLYFCSRDQAVFYPGENDFAPAEQTRSFLREA
jgi:hypothetical protein